MLTQSFFSRKRSEFFEQLPEQSVVVLAGAALKSRSRDIHYPFRQDSDFFYLTGWNEPDAVAVLSKDAQGQPHFMMFCEPNDPEKARWDGQRLGPDAATESYGADEAFPPAELAVKLAKKMSNAQVVYANKAAQAYVDQEALSVDAIIHEMRLIKSDEEIDLIQKACDLSSKAHQAAMKLCRPGLRESDIDALLWHEFVKNQAIPAYPSIVAGGENACVLHYHQNQAQLADGDLLLVDAGCEVVLYASDLTRTFPINGTFNPEQKAIYELVLAVQLAVIDQIKPGATMQGLQALAIEILVQGMMDLGLLQGELEDLIETKAYRPFYMHGIGHWMGLDVHGVGAYEVEGQHRKFEPGLVLTVEPGIYIEANAGVAPQWRGIGVRIEDDVLVTAEGCRVFSQALPKTVEAIEALMFGHP